MQCKRALGGFILAELALEHVGKVYRNGYEAIHDFSLEIKEGEFLILVGPSGCGKSTLLRMIAGLEDISSGELWVDGEIENYKEPRERNLAMVFQNYALFPHMNVAENIALVCTSKAGPRRHQAQNRRNARAGWSARL